MIKKKLPWFKCNPEKFLNGIADLPTSDQKLLYMVLVLRIYDAEGPIKENVGLFASRTAIPPGRVKIALAELVNQGKIVTSDGLLSNPMAESILEDRKEKTVLRSEAGKAAAQARWKKDKQKQQPSDAIGMQNDAYLEVRGKKEDQQTQNPPTTHVGSKRSNRPRSADDYTTEFDGVWVSYPRTRGTSKKNAFKQWNKLSDAQRATVIRVMPTWRALMSKRDEDKIKHLEFYLSANVFETLEQATIVARDESAVVDPRHFTDVRWTSLVNVYKITNDWKQSWGPPPGYPGCLLPEKFLLPISKATLDTHAAPA